MDYIDLDGGRVVSRRSSIAEVLGTFENLNKAEPPKTNGHCEHLPNKESQPKVPKSPVKCIDNTVMNIRVGDRIYKVDDRNKFKILEVMACFLLEDLFQVWLQYFYFEKYRFEQSKTFYVNAGNRSRTIK